MSHLPTKFFLQYRQFNEHDKIVQQPELNFKSYDC